MSEQAPSEPSSPEPLPGTAPLRREPGLWSSTIYRLCEEVVALREIDNRQHKLFEQSLNRSREALQASFTSFAADTQRAYQQLRQEIHGEKRTSLDLLNVLLEIGADLERIAASRPTAADPDALARWADAVDVETRKVQAVLRQHGVHPYDAVVGAAYNPALHERVGSRRLEGMEPMRVAEQVEHGYASQQPEFVLRRPKVIISE